MSADRPMPGEEGFEEAFEEWRQDNHSIEVANNQYAIFTDQDKLCDISSNERNMVKVAMMTVQRFGFHIVPKEFTEKKMFVCWDMDGLRGYPPDYGIQGEESRKEQLKGSESITVLNYANGEYVEVDIESISEEQIKEFWMSGYEGVSSDLLDEEQESDTKEK